MAPAAAPTPVPISAPLPAPYPVPAPTAAPAPAPTAAPPRVPHAVAVSESSDSPIVAERILLVLVLVIVVHIPPERLDGGNPHASETNRDLGAEIPSVVTRMHCRLARFLEKGTAMCW